MAAFGGVEMAGSPKLWFRTGVKLADLTDCSVHGKPTMQYTVTGAMRRKKRQAPLGSAVTVNNREVTLFRWGEEVVYAVQSRCPHQGAMLAGGDIEIEDLARVGSRPCVSCPHHHWKFDMLSGCKVVTGAYLRSAGRSSPTPLGLEQSGDEHRLAIYPTRLELEGEHKIVLVGFERIDSATFDDTDF